MQLAKILLYDGDTGDGSVTQQAQTVLDVVARLKPLSRSAAIPWLTFLRYALSEELPDICHELRDMMSEMQDKHKKSTSVDVRTMPMALKLASDGGCQLNDDEKTIVARQLREARGPANIPLTEAEFFVQIVGSVVSSYPPGGNDIAYISSAEYLTPYLVAARSNLSPPTSSLHIPLMPLLKLTNYLMTAQDRWKLAYFGHVVIKNAIKVARSVKRDASQFAEAQNSMDR